MAQSHNNKQMVDRKLEHIRIVKEERVEPLGNPFEKYRLPYSALPEISLEDIDTSIDFLGYHLSFPFLVGSMTGGPQKAKDINTNLAIACEQEKVPMGLGSMRVVIKDPAALKSFQVKKHCPSMPVFANLGLVQLNYGFGADEINKLMELSEADGIFLHVNHLQEAVQPEGDTNFKDLIPKLEKLLPKIEKPVIIKEVGAGIDVKSAKMLKAIGVSWIDVAGLGGTSWTVVEAYRREDSLGFVFGGEGIPTDAALIECSQVQGLNLIASGGIRSGLDVAKSIVLGAKLASAAKPLLQAALSSPEECIKVLQQLKREFKVALFTTGVSKVSELKNLKLILK